MRSPSAQAVLDALPVEIAILDQAGRIQAWNRAWDSFEQDARPAIDWKGTDYLAVSQGPEGGDAARRGILEVLAGKRARFELEYPCHSPSAQRWFEMTAVRLQGPGGPWVLLAHTNITSRHEAERLRRRRWTAAEQLRAAGERARFMRGLVNELAHEINTPLTALSLQLGVVLPLLPAKAASVLRTQMDRVALVTQRIGAIVVALEKAPTATRVDLPSLAAALEALAPEARRRGVVLESDLADGSVQADADMLAQCVGGLVTSGVLSCPAGGRLHLSATAGPPAQVTVTADTVGAMGGTEADLWLMAARELARRAGLALRESGRDGPRATFVLEIPLLVGQAPPDPGPDGRLTAPSHLSPGPSSAAR